MKIFHYDPVFGLFLYEGEADPNPLDPDDPIIPAYATAFEPLPPVEGNLVVFTGERWGYVLASDPGQPSDQPVPPPPPPPITPEDVGRERDRRLAIGFHYVFPDERGVHFLKTTEEDMRGWDRVTKLKDVLLQVGDTTSKIEISTGTGRTEVTAPEWNAILLYAAVNFEQPLWQASFDLSEEEIIPLDYKDDKYWPASIVTEEEELTL